MPLTDRFRALALYPGGQGFCGIVFNDPGIPETNDIRKITLPWSVVQPLIWNMHDWEVRLSATIAGDIDIGTPPLVAISGSVDIRGRFFSCSASNNPDTPFVGYTIISTNAAPKDQVCGDATQRAYSDDAGFVTDVTSSIQDQRLFPYADCAYAFTVGSGGFGPTVITGSVGSVGDFTFTYDGLRYSDPASLFVSFGVQKIWVKTDGNCDVFAVVQVNYTDGGTGVIANNTSGSSLGTISATFLGQGFTIPLFGPSNFTLTGSAFDFDVIVSSAWTYPP